MAPDDVGKRRLLSSLPVRSRSLSLTHWDKSVNAYKLFQNFKFWSSIVLFAWRYWQLNATVLCFFTNCIYRLRIHCSYQYKFNKSYHLRPILHLMHRLHISCSHRGRYRQNHWDCQRSYGAAIRCCSFRAQLSLLSYSLCSVVYMCSAGSKLYKASSD